MEIFLLISKKIICILICMKKYELFAHIFTMLFIRLFGKIETISSVCSGVTGYYSRQCSAVSR